MQVISQVYVGTCHICEYHSSGTPSYRHICELILLGTFNFFTETQLLPYHLAYDIDKNLSPFMVERQDDIDRFLSLAMCYNRSVKVIEQHYFQALNALHFCAVFCQQDSCVKIKFLLLYRKQHNVNNFIQNLRNILNEVSVDMVLGDFKVN